MPQHRYQQQTKGKHGAESPAMVRGGISPISAIRIGGSAGKSSKIAGINVAYFAAQIRKHREDRNKLITDVRNKLDAVEKENRALNAEERAQVDQLNSAIADHETRIGDLENASGEIDAISDVSEDRSQPAPQASGRIGRPIEIEDRALAGIPTATKEYRSAYQHWLLSGEKRDVLLGVPAQGGFLVAPYQMSKQIVQQLANLTFVRQLATVEEVTSAAALRIPVVTSRVADPQWTTEGQCITEDTQLAIGHVDLTPSKLLELVTVSDEMIATYANLDSFINDQLAVKYGYVEENAYLNGTGSGQPLGVFTANANGISTARDVTSINAGTINGDDLIALRYSIKQQYLNSPSCRWVMGRSTIAAVRTLKDQYGQYLLQMGLADNRPDTLIGVPVCVSEFAPSTIATGAYVAVLGDWKYYTIAEYLGGFSVQRLVERYADCGMVGFKGRRFLSGAPVQPEAFARLKCK